MKFKYILIGIFVIIGIYVCFNTDPFSYLNEEKTYYGKVDKHQSKIKVYSKDDEYTINKDLVIKDIANGSFFKITFTDGKGVIVETKKVKQSDIPEEVQAKMNIK